MDYESDDYDDAEEDESGETRREESSGSAKSKAAGSGVALPPPAPLFFEREDAEWTEEEELPQTGTPVSLFL